MLMSNSGNEKVCTYDSIHFFFRGGAEIFNDDINKRAWVCGVVDLTTKFGRLSKCQDDGSSLFHFQALIQFERVEKEPLLYACRTLTSVR
jgi:hypothetical protein